ncbi:hypothetical protein YC2023_091429 [Brassica napus]
MLANLSHYSSPPGSPNEVPASSRNVPPVKEQRNKTCFHYKIASWHQRLLSKIKRFAQKKSLRQLITTIIIISSFKKNPRDYFIAFFRFAFDL